MKRLILFLLAALLLLTGCKAKVPETAEPTKPAEPTESTNPAEPTESTKPVESAELTGPVSGIYCVLGVDGERTYPEWTALKFDFENGKFNFGTPVVTEDWIRKGELTVEGNRITAVSNKQKSVFEDGQLKILGNITWVFEFQLDGTIRYIPEGSDEYTIYGTELNAESVLVRTGDLDKPLE